jgi:capsular polysaccharide transport system ATP-binding protein
MLRVTDVVKEYPLKGRNLRAVNGVSFTLHEGERLGIMGHNGSGKSTLIRLIGGSELPTEGQIEYGMSVSWPIGLAGGGFGVGLTGMDNIRFICRIYGAPFRQVRDFVADFSELGNFLYEPVRIYSMGMLAKFFFGLSLAIEFDCYLTDEVFAVGDTRFQKKCHEELFVRKKDKAFIIATHVPELIKQYCSKVLVMRAGCGKVFTDVDTAIEIYQSL